MSITIAKWQHLQCSRFFIRLPRLAITSESKRVDNLKRVRGDKYDSIEAKKFHSVSAFSQLLNSSRATISFKVQFSDNRFINLIICYFSLKFYIFSHFLVSAIKVSKRKRKRDFGKIGMRYKINILPFFNLCLISNSLHFT